MPARGTLVLRVTAPGGDADAAIGLLDEARAADPGPQFV